MSKKKKQQGYLRLSSSSKPKMTTLSGKKSRSITSQEDLTSQLWERLQGSWVGLDGFNMIAMPRLGTEPTDMGDFVLAASPYVETLVFTNPGGAARNRGGSVDQFVAALEYHQRVTASPKADNFVDPTDDAPAFNGELLHVETGMFLNLSNKKDNNGEPVETPKFNIARSGTIPHGNAIMLLGTPPTFTLGAPKFKDINTEPKPVPPMLGYTDLYLNNPKIKNPVIVLKEHLNKQKENGLKVKNTITFSFDSENSGGIMNIPFIKNRADTVGMRCTFWLETIEVKKTGQIFDQLQYQQEIFIDFHKFSKKKDGLIGWPHVTVNTLVKQ